MRRTVLLLACTALAVLLACGAALAAVSATADSGTVQTDGRVSAVLRLGDRVYLGGNFTQVDGEARSHLAAIDAETGQLTGWAPATNATGKVFALAASPDGSRVYAGGAFTSVDGKARKRIAALDASSGALDPSFRADADNGVRALAVSGNGDLYAGGAFSSVGGQPRTRLAKLDGSTGAVDPGWAPSADGLVRDLEPSPDGSRLYAGGEFKTISGQPRAHLVGLDAAGTGAIAWRPLTSPNGKAYDLAARGNSLYSAEGGGGGEARSYDAATGALVWRARGDGDVQAVAPLDGRLYLGGHFERLSGQGRPFLAAVDATTGLLDPWNPTANAGDGLGLGVFALTPDGSQATGTTRIYAGGDFTRVAGVSHAHFALFSDAPPPPPPPTCDITGTAGNDALAGTPGDDVICGGGGNDTVKGLEGNDTLRGEGGADQLHGGGDDDLLDGGAGNDFANFSDSPAAVTASLADNVAAGDGSDVLVDLENLAGSPGDDTLTGSDADNKIKGGMGADRLTGEGGADTLVGAGGNDTVDSKDGISGNDSLDGGGGTDTAITDASEKSMVGFP